MPKFKMKLTGGSAVIDDCQDSLFVAARTEETSADTDDLVEKAKIFCPTLNSKFALTVTSQVLQRP